MAAKAAPSGNGGGSSGVKLSGVSNKAANQRRRRISGSSVFGIMATSAAKRGIYRGASHRRIDKWRKRRNIAPSASRHV